MSILRIKSCCRLQEERINTAISVPPGGWLLPQRNDVIRGPSLLRPGCCLCSVMPNSVTSWTVAHCSPLSMKFSGQEYWNRLLFSPLGDLPDSEWTHVSCISWIGRWILFFFFFFYLFTIYIYSFFFFNFTILYWFCHISTLIHQWSITQVDSLLLRHSLKLMAKLALMKTCQDFWSYYILIIHLLIYCGQFFFPSVS